VGDLDGAAERGCVVGAQQRKKPLARTSQEALSRRGGTKLSNKRGSRADVTAVSNRAGSIRFSICTRRTDGRFQRRICKTLESSVALKTIKAGSSIWRHKSSRGREASKKMGRCSVVGDTRESARTFQATAEWTRSQLQQKTRNLLDPESSKGNAKRESPTFGRCVRSSPVTEIIERSRKLCEVSHEDF